MPTMPESTESQSLFDAVRQTRDADTAKLRDAQERIRRAQERREQIMEARRTRGIRLEDTV